MWKKVPKKQEFGRERRRSVDGITPEKGGGSNYPRRRREEGRREGERERDPFLPS